MKQKTYTLWGLSLLLVVAVGSVWALTPQVSWEPSMLRPVSVAPGEAVTYEVTLTNTGLVQIPVGQQLQVVASGEVAASYITIVQPQFSQGTFKRGASVHMTLIVTVPSDTPFSVKRGTLTLCRLLPNGTVKEIIGEALPVELTFSAISLPPDPGEAGTLDRLGVDSNNNEVRDDIERYIVSTYPDSEKKRAALFQSARSLNAYLRDAEDKEKTRENGVNEEKAIDCLAYVFNDDLDARDNADVKLRSKFLNTVERSRAYKRADFQMGGYVSNSGLSSERENRIKAACNFNVDSLSN